MKYIENDKLVEKESTEQSKTCQHRIVRQKNVIDDTRYRYCQHCGMVAHEDGSFAYYCGMEYCRCAM